MTKILDQTSDINGQQLYRLSKLYTLPAFVKKASSTDIYGVDELETHQYADPATRQFPCHTAASTYISTLFFMDKRAELDTSKAEYMDNRLDDFAFVHGITDTIKGLRDKLATITKSASADASEDDFALLLSKDESDTGKAEKYYPLRNALEVKKAAEYLSEYKAELPYKYRQRMAEKILEKADVYGAGLGDLDDFLHKQAGHGAAAAEEIAKMLFSRAKLMKRAKKVEYGIKMAEIARSVLDNNGVHDQDKLVKLACLVDDADRESGLNRYLLDLPAVEDIFFNITEKKASQLRSEHFATTSGNTYKLADTDKLKLAEVKALMGSDFAEAISTGGLFVSPEKLAEIAPTLPRGDATLFDKMLATFGIHPVAKEAAYEDTSLTQEELKEWARIHQTKERQ